MGLKRHYYEKTSGGDGIPAELFQSLKDDAVKVLHSICQQIWKTQQWPQDWKRSVFMPIPKKGNAKECSNYRTMTNLDSILKSRDITLPKKVHLVKVMVFPVVIYGCEIWTLKAEHQRIGAFELWFWRRLLRVP